MSIKDISCRSKITHEDIASESAYNELLWHE